MNDIGDILSDRFILTVAITLLCEITCKMKYNRCYGVSNESPYNSALNDTHNGEFDEKKKFCHTSLDDLHRNERSKN